MRLGLFLAIVSAVLCAQTVRAANPYGLNENHPYGVISNAYVTPHVAWANPYAGGAIRAFVMAPTWSQRETVELAERLSLDYTAWMPSTFPKIVYSTVSDPAFAFFQPPPDLVNRALRDGLKKKYDVIIVGKLDWAMVPGKERLAILKQVSEGTGLVYVTPPKGNKELEIVFGGTAMVAGVDFITANLPLPNLPAFAALPADRLVKTCLFGKGRVVILNYDEKVPEKEWESEAYPALTPPWKYEPFKDGYVPVDKLPEAEFVPYEYYQALVAKAVVWASGKEPRTPITGIALPADLSWPVAGRSVTVSVRQRLPGMRVKAALRARREYTHVWPIAPREAGDTISFNLPAAPAGDYFLDVWLTTADGKQTLDWASKFLAVTDAFSFGDIALKKNSFNPGDMVEGTVVLPRPLDATEELVVSLTDNYDRLIQSTPVQVSGLSVPFALGPLAPLTTLHTVEAKLVRGKQAAVRKTYTFPVRTMQGRDDFNEISWAGGSQLISLLMLKKLAEEDELLSPELGWSGCTMARNIALANMIPTPYVARYGCFGGAPDHILKPDPNSAYGCMSHPVTLENLKKWGTLQSEMLGPYGPFCWTHGDETFYASDPDVCWCPNCLDVFRKYLKTSYPDLATLNRDWKTNYASWDEVQPLTFKQAKETKNYAPWVERCRSSNLVFAHFYKASSDDLAVGDPGNRAGFDGGPGITAPNAGGDWWTLSRNNGILQDYNYCSAEQEMIRSFGKPDQVKGIYYGTYGLSWGIGPNTVPFCHFDPWYSLFHKFNTTWFWTMGCPGSLSGYAPDLTNLPFFEARTEALRAIRSGLGKLLLPGDRQNDGIAIFDSEASRIAESLFALKEGDWGNAWVEAHANFNKALQDCGLQYDYVSYEQLPQGELMRRKFKLLIMPHCRAVSSQEADAIRAFVKAGGTVIADILPGMLDGHGAIQEKSLLADLFPNDKPGALTYTGNGKTILLGEEMLKDYGKIHEGEQGWKTLKSRWHALGDLLQKEVRLTPAITVFPTEGSEMPPTEITRIRCGTIEFDGLLREYNLRDYNTYRATVAFPSAAYVYDVLEGKYLGYTDRVDTSLSYRAKLYARSPYRVSGVTLTLPGRTAGGPTPVEIRLTAEGNATASRHGFRLEVTGPDGKKIRYYAQNLVADGGRTTATIPFALNEQPGTYIISVRDVMSGLSAQRSLVITGGNR